MATAIFIIFALLFVGACIYNILDKAEMQAHRLKQRQKRRGW